ncbi:MAG: hypothetical protein NTW21_18895, partial [Verrucomicrobia bacterium]|nr:hypothetical protein [Verrucomicrobiota bacterium]
MPTTVSIPAGTTSATFTLTAPNNTLLDGSQLVTITAAASGFLGASGTTTVRDNDAHHYAFATIASPQNQGSPFSVTITAQDASNATVTTYTGTPGLTASGSSGTLSIAPTGASGFVSGVWTGTVTVNAMDPNVVLTVTDNAGRTGASNAFNVAAPTDYFTELFDPSANDVSNQSFLFTPNGLVSFYAVQRTSASAFPTDPTGGTSLTLSDDSHVQVTPAGGVLVSLYGVTYPTFYVGSNGYVTFGTGDSTFTESLADHFSKPRISALFDDLNPGSAGTVTWKQLADRVAVTFQGVPEYYKSNSNNFQIEMFFDGRIRITCLAIAATDGLIGLSGGRGVPAGFVESDFSAYLSTTLGLAISPNPITEGDASATGTITVSPAPTSNLTVSLASNDTSEATVPASASIPAGQTSATFPIAILDDAVLDGTQYATITATATGYPVGSAVLAVQDHETATLAVTAPATTSEGAGTVQGTVTASAAPARAVSVNLTSSDPAVLTVPATVTIPAGQTSAAFTITVVDDNKINGTHSATITAHVANWTNGTTTISITDNENSNLALTLPSSVTEGGSGSGSVSISGTLTSDLTVTLASDTTSRLTMPATVSIPAGATSATFALTAPDNTLTDGTQAIAITASATGFTDASGTTNVLDNDVHHYAVSAIAPSQVAGVAFSVTLTAKDVNNVTIASYT